MKKKKVTNEIIKFMVSVGCIAPTSDIENHAARLGFNIHEADGGIGYLRSIKALKIISDIPGKRGEHIFKLV